MKGKKGRNFELSKAKKKKKIDIKISLRKINLYQDVRRPSPSAARRPPSTAVRTATFTAVRRRPRFAVRRPPDGTPSGRRKNLTDGGTATPSSSLAIYRDTNELAESKLDISRMLKRSLSAFVQKTGFHVLSARQGLN